MMTRALGPVKWGSTVMKSCCAVGSGHEAAIKAFQRVVKPAALRFKPDIILVGKALLSKYSH